MGRIKAISFDLVGTLVEEGFIDAFWSDAIPLLYAEKEGMGFEDAKALVLSQYDEVGRDDLRWYLPGYWLQRFGLGQSVEEVLLTAQSKLKVYPDVLEALHELRPSYKLVVSSGASREIAEFVTKGIGNHFDGIFSSVSNFNQIRKTSAFYLEVCRRIGVDPHSMVHVGDNLLYDYEASQRAGLRAYLIDRKGEKRSPDVLKSLRELKARIEPEGL